MIWKTLNEVEEDVKQLGLLEEKLVEDFMISHGEVSANICVFSREIMKMSCYGLRAA